MVTRQYDEQGRKIESYFLNDLPAHLVMQKFIGIPAAIYKKQWNRSPAVNLGFGIDLRLNYCIRRCDYLNVYWLSFIAN
jgi:hypothetical protein